jgi:hypothetical protein
MCLKKFKSNCKSNYVKSQIVHSNYSSKSICLWPRSVDTTVYRLPKYRALRKAGCLKSIHQKLEPCKFLGNFGIPVFWELTWDFYKIQADSADNIHVQTKHPPADVLINWLLSETNFSPLPLRTAEVSSLWECGSFLKQLTVCSIVILLSFLFLVSKFQCESKDLYGISIFCRHKAPVKINWALAPGNM